MDEQKLRDLFASAVRDVPPASFDDADIATESRRVTVRRRKAMFGGSAVAVVVIAAGLVFGTGVLGHNLGGTPTEGNASGAAQGQSTFGRNAVGPRTDTQGGNHAQNEVPNTGTEPHFPTTTPLQGGGTVGGVGPGAGGTPSGCGPTDGKLAVALANELAAVGAPEAMPPGLSCAAGSRSAGYLVHDGSASGYVVAVVTTAGQTAPTETNVGAAKASAPASGGRTVTVLSVPAAGSPSAPLSGAIFGMAEDLAGKV
jgi:hypothetical protein